LAVVGALLALLLGVHTAAAETILEFQSDLTGWLDGVDGVERYAFDSFYPGVPGIADLTGPSVILPLTSTVLTITVESGSGALHDGTSIYGQASDAKLPNSVTSRWEFSPPISALYTYYGSWAQGVTVTMFLYADDNLVATFSRENQGLSAVAAYGHGFTSTVPVDRVEFRFVENDDTVLIGGFVGVGDDSSLGQIHIPGYQGPHGDMVDYDFGISTVPMPTVVRQSTWGRIKGLYR
jgi:hypothetical protein